MRLSKRKRSTMVNPDMTPLIDVVFLLIIFFMTVTQASKANHQVLELPRLHGSADTNEAKGAITVNIDHAGALTMAGQIFTIPQARARLTSLIQSTRQSGQGVFVSLRVDRRSTSQAANEIVRLLVELGVNRSRIAVQSAAPQGGN